MAFDVEGARKAGYSDAEIADHLAAGANLDAAAARKAGHSDAALIAHLTAGDKPGLLEAGARGLGLGTRAVVQGAAAFPGAVADAVTWPVRAGQRALGIPTTAPSDLVQSGVEATGLPQPETPGERGAAAVIEPVAGALTGVGIGKVLQTAASPVVQAVGRTMAQQPVTQATAAGAGGAVEQATDSPTAGLATSTALPLVTGGVASAARSLTGSAVSQGDAMLGRIARSKYNIDVAAPDLSRNQFYRNVYDQTGKLPFSGAGKAYDAKIGQWQGAIANEMGEPGVKAFTTDVMSRARDRIGQTFDNVATRTNIPNTETPQLIKELDAIAYDADLLASAEAVTPLKKQIQGIKDLIATNNGEISGDVYQRLTRAKGLLSRLEKNPDVGDLAGDVRDALDDAFARSAAPGDRDALRQARYQYRVMRTADQLVAGSRDGNISPDAFMQKVQAAERKFDLPTGGMAYGGGGNIAELARIGKLFRAPPQTGTSDRMAVNLTTGGLMGGSLATLNPLMIATVPATLAANRLVQTGLRSGPVAEQAINTALGTGPTRPNAFLTAFDAALQNRIQNRNDLDMPTITVRARRQD